MHRLPLVAHNSAGLPVEITAEGDLRSLPCHMAEAGGMDGFYIARLVRHG